MKNESIVYELSTFTSTSPLNPLPINMTRGVCITRYLIDERMNVITPSHTRFLPDTFNDGNLGLAQLRRIKRCTGRRLKEYQGHHLQVRA